MEKWKIAAFAAVFLLLAVIVVDVVLIARYASMPRPGAVVRVTKAAPAAQTVVREKQVRVPEPVVSVQFPAPPSANGVEKEYWDGFYYSSTDPFERAIQQGIPRTHFWFEVRRTADGSFQAA